jgi:hypothetical protein
MKDKWIVIIAVVAFGGVGYLYWKDKQNASSNPGSTLLTLLQGQPIADSSVGSYVDPTGGMDYVDAVPVSVTSPTGFTAADYNYGVMDESPVANVGNGYDLVNSGSTNTGYTIVPTGAASLSAYDKVVG